MAHTPEPRKRERERARERERESVGDVLAEVKKALQALVEWTTQHWGDDVELVGRMTWSP